MNALPAPPPEFIAVEVILALPDRAIAQTLNAPRGTTLQELRHHPELSEELRLAWAQAAGVGIFGQKVPMRSVLEAGDRVELWRPLQADPKEARRQRAKLKARSV